MRWGLVALSAILIYLLHPLTWSNPAPALWSPSVGLGLALAAWFGWRCAVAALAGACLILLLHYGLAGVLQARGVVDELARRLDLRGHLTQAELHGLVLEDGLPEGDAFLRVLEGRLESRAPVKHRCVS